MKSIRSKIFLIIFLSVIISSFIIGSLGLMITSTVAIDDSRENMNLLCRVNANKMDFIFSNVENSVDTLSHYASEELTSIEDLKNLEYRKEFTAALKRSALHHADHSESTLAIYVRYSLEIANDTAGFFLVRNDTSGDFKDEPLTDISKYPKDDVEHVGWWYAPIEAGKSIWLDAYHNSNIDCDIISYATPFYKDGRLIGVIGIDLSVESVKEAAKEITIFNTGKIAVFERDGTMIYHPEIETGAKIEEYDKSFASVVDTLTRIKHTDDLISYTINGENKKLASYTLRNGMIMACFAPVSEIYSHSNKLLFAIFAITIIVPAIFSVFAFLISKKITDPIKNINKAAKHLIQGDFSFNEKPASNDEIGELTNTFLETQNILKRQFELLDAEAHRDGLTGVGNKSAYIDKESQINSLISSGDADFAVAVFDVNKLKITNDVFGHVAGDNLLFAVSSHLAKHFQLTNVFRIGGDEFVIISLGKNATDFEEKVRNCVDSMPAVSVNNFPEIRVSCAYGTALFDKYTDSQFSDVLRKADMAMYRNKTLTKQETFPWQEGEKGFKRIQTERYSHFLQALCVSTDDYFFLINTELQAIHFFENSEEKTCLISDFISAIHPNDADFVNQALAKIINHESDFININFRLGNGENLVVEWANLKGRIVDEVDDRYLMIGRVSKNTVKHLYSPLTSLPNKLKLKNDIESLSTPDFTSLLLLDIDNLSEINFRRGFTFGDDLLKTLAEYLEQRFTMSRVYHAERDRFVVLLDVNSKNEIEAVYEDIKVFLEGKCTISAAIVPNDESLYMAQDNIYNYAEQILNNAKKNGVSQLVFFSKQSFLERISQVELSEEIKESVANDYDGFYIMYQPQVKADTCMLVSAEALLRYNSKTKGVIFPDIFIPILEKTGLINGVGLWVTKQALAQCKKWREKMPDMKICVNISSVQLKEKRTALQIIQLLKEFDLPGDALTLEITETVRLEDNSDLHVTLRKFMDAGIKIAIDDFGTGYSNLGYLKQMHADIIKIDRMFVKDIKENSYNFNLIYNIIDFAKQNSLSVCLEGVETVSEYITLSDLGADYIQGFLFDKPRTVDEIEEKYFNQENRQFIERSEFVKRILAERKHAPGITIDTKSILSETKVGLWVIRSDENEGSGELFADHIMKTLLGVEDVTPEECYEHWYSHIKSGYEEMVNSMVEEMKKTTKVVQVEYPWIHPERGEVIVRCTGRCVKGHSGRFIFEGFHRIISDMGKTFG